jgi:hypothetical protein
MKRKGDSGSVRTVRKNGQIEWKDKDGKLHREDGPALEWPEKGATAWYIHGRLHREDGSATDGPLGKGWYRNGKKHREDGPAVVLADGRMEWYRNGGFHREDGPASERLDGTKVWYRQGKLHREGGPASEGPEGRFWWRNGKPHRVDGPAMEFADGRTEWWIDGVELTPEQVASIREKQINAIGDAFKQGLDHKIAVKAIGGLNRTSGPKE